MWHNYSEILNLYRKYSMRLSGQKSITDILRVQSSKEQVLIKVSPSGMFKRKTSGCFKNDQSQPYAKPLCSL